MAANKLTLEERFWSKVRKTDTCWLWTAQLNNKGYGRFFYYPKTTRRGSYGLYAHRVSWNLAHGDIPAKMRVLHKCDTPACVRPDHLFIGTQRDNIRDCIAKGRSHPYGGWIRSKLTPNDVRTIRSDPRKHHIIAADYGLLRNAVWKIKHRKSWVHVD
jgi:hypothetical protein